VKYHVFISSLLNLEAGLAVLMLVSKIVFEVRISNIHFMVFSSFYTELRFTKRVSPPITDLREFSMRKRSPQKDHGGDDHEDQEYDHGYPEKGLVGFGQKEEVGYGYAQTIQKMKRHHRC